MKTQKEIEFKDEYDYSNKPYYVLCRSGWIEPTYIYRHKTNKDIYRVIDDNTIVDVTQDHSLFDSEQKELKPSDINVNTKLEYFKKNIIIPEKNITNERIIELSKSFNDNNLDCLPIDLINSNKDNKKLLNEIKQRIFI